MIDYTAKLEKEKKENETIEANKMINKAKKSHLNRDSSSSSSNSSRESISTSDSSRSNANLPDKNYYCRQTHDKNRDYFF